MPPAACGPKLAAAPSVRQKDLHSLAGPCRVLHRLRGPGTTSLMFDGRGFREGWTNGPLVALSPHVVLSARTEANRSLAAIEDLVAGRRAEGGTAETGVAVLLAYDLLDPDAADDAGFPRVIAMAVDRSLRYTSDDSALLTVRRESGADRGDESKFLQVADRLRGLGPQNEGRQAARVTGRPGTSLPRETYLQAVKRVLQHIRAGNVYQANLTQRFAVTYRGDAFELYARLASTLPAPHTAYMETPQLTLASVSPETFLRMRAPGELETRPIKGTRPRGSTPAEDRAAARNLLDSAKDRAELLMIVDLERNDLSRICHPGSVRVTDLAALRSYRTVHHLVATVRGSMRDGTGLQALLQATFPGGSITGAPKLRAMQILRELEPVSRNYFTGSLLWFGDDGTLDSSILIRTLVFDAERAYLGAGGGIVADSEPEAEWEESNHKARGLATALGFDPREACESP